LLEMPGRAMDRTMNWLLQRKYAALLLALALLFVGYPLLRGFLFERLVYAALVGLVFLAALLVLFRQRRLWLLGLLLGLPTLVGSWTGYVLRGWPREHFALAFHAFAVLFFALIIVLILRGTYQEQVLTADSLCGAFCGYLLLGLAFGHLYWIMEALRPGSFHGSVEMAAHLANAEQRHAVLTSYSFGALTTLGSEIRPRRALARELAWIEAVLGQFYLVVLMAELIGLHVAAVSRRQGEDAKRAGP
jgi:hypothetical protein